MNDPRVTCIRIYPIKGLDPLPVESTRVLASGALEFDRRWALVDTHGKYVNGKNYKQVFQTRANYDLAKLEVTLDGILFSLTSDGQAIERWFSERVGEKVTWRENTEAGFPDDTNSPGPTFVSSASIAIVAEWFALPLEQAQRRFRTNVEFDHSEPFWEDRLYGSQFLVGATAFDAINPCQRCIVPSCDADTGAQDAGFQKRFAELRKANIPSFAQTAQFNHYYRFAVNTRIAASAIGKMIHVGDPLVYVE